MSKGKDPNPAISMQSEYSHEIKTLGLIIHTHGDSDGKTYWQIPGGCRLIQFSTIPIGVVSINDLNTVRELSFMFMNFCKENIKLEITNEKFAQNVRAFQFQYISYYVQYFIPEMIKLLLENMLELNDIYAKTKQSKKDPSIIAEKQQYLIDLTRLLNVIKNNPEYLMVCRVFNGGDKVLLKTYSSNQTLLTEARKEVFPTDPAKKINTNWQVTVLRTLPIKSTTLSILENPEKENIKAATAAAYNKSSGKAVKSSGKAVNPQPLLDLETITQAYVHVLPGSEDDKYTSGFVAPEIIVDKYAKKIADRTTTAHHISFTNEILFKHFFFKDFPFMCVLDNACNEIKNQDQTLVTDWKAIMTMRDAELEISPGAYRMNPSDIEKIKTKIEQITYTYIEKPGVETMYTVSSLMHIILRNSKYGTTICGASRVCPDTFNAKMGAAYENENEALGVPAAADETVALYVPVAAVAAADEKMVLDVPVAAVAAADEKMVLDDVPVAAVAAEENVNKRQKISDQNNNDLEGGTRSRRKRRSKKFRKTHKKRRSKRKTKKR